MAKRYNVKKGDYQDRRGPPGLLVDTKSQFNSACNGVTESRDYASPICRNRLKDVGKSAIGDIPKVRALDLL